MAKAIRQQINRFTGKVISEQALDTELEVRAAIAAATTDYTHGIQDNGLWFELSKHSSCVWRIISVE